MACIFRSLLIWLVFFPRCLAYFALLSFTLHLPSIVIVSVGHDRFPNLPRLLPFKDKFGSPMCRECAVMLGGEGERSKQVVLINLRSSSTYICLARRRAQHVPCLAIQNPLSSYLGMSILLLDPPSHFRLTRCFCCSIITLQDFDQCTPVLAVERKQE